MWTDRFRDRCVYFFLHICEKLGVVELSIGFFNKLMIEKSTFCLVERGQDGRRVIFVNKYYIISSSFMCICNNFFLKRLILYMRARTRTHTYIFLSVLIQAGLTQLESLNLDSCRIGDEGLVNLTGYFISRLLSLCTLIRELVN